MENEDSSQKLFQLRQEGRDYLLSLSIVDNCVRLSCQESFGKLGSFYENDFSLSDLIAINKYFKIVPTIQEAQNELIKAIEKQKAGVENNLTILKIVFYIMIGTDKFSIKLPLTKRDNIYKRIKFPEEQEPFTGKIQLKNRGNYPEDEKRIDNLEKNSSYLAMSEKSLISEIQKLLEITENLMVDSSLLYEENAKLNMRLQKIEKENESRNLEVDELKKEEQELNNENIKLKNYNIDLEKALEMKKEHLRKSYRENRQKQINKDNVDLGNGPVAISSRFETTKVKTYIPRVTAKPIIDSYEEANLNRTKPESYFKGRNNFNFSSANDRNNQTDINIKSVQIGNTNEYLKQQLDKDPLDNRKRIIKNNITDKPRITEKSNDYEDEIIKPGRTSDLISQSQKEPDEIKDNESIVRDSDFQPSHSDIIFSKEQTEFENDEDKNNYIDSDIIQTSVEEEMLLNKINKHEKELSINLIYKASVDSDSAEVFHKKCDNAQRTLVIIETINGRRFGGYTTQSWEGNGVDKKDEEAFIFSLDKLQTYNIISNHPAIGCYPKYGPVFLGCQIKINDNFFVKGGTTFKRNINYATNSDFELNDGIKFFVIKDIEVFEINLV